VARHDHAMRPTVSSPRGGRGLLARGAHRFVFQTFQLLPIASQNVHIPLFEVESVIRRARAAGVARDEGTGTSARQTRSTGAARRRLGRSRLFPPAGCDVAVT